LILIEVTVREDSILVSDIHPEFEQQAFLHALAKSQRNNPFLRVLNENIPLILLLKTIKKLNADKKFNEINLFILPKINKTQFFCKIKNCCKS
jgi:hypothetical protein